MNLERYDYDRERTYKEYFFFSEGPNGRVLKSVRFDLVKTRPMHVYNLVLGDWDNEQGEIDYWSVTNNGDTEKVLATVAAIVLDFTDIFNRAVIRIKGGDDARTRLYQMRINKYLDEINEIFNVCGDLDGDLIEFQKNVKYNKFFIARRDYVILKEPNEIYMTSSTKNKEVKKRVYNDTITDRPYLVPDDHPALVEKREEARKDLDRIMPQLEAFLRKHGHL